jgi:hypothetical protein
MQPTAASRRWMTDGSSPLFPTQGGIPMPTIDLPRTAAAERLYWFQLTFPDGRWTVQEKQLPAPPETGDLVDLGADGCWHVRDSRLVPVRPSGKPAREFFVCRPH